MKTGVGVAIATGGTAAPIAIPAEVAGLLLAGAGLAGVRRFCTGLLKGGLVAVTSDAGDISTLSGGR